MSTATISPSSFGRAPHLRLTARGRAVISVLCAIVISAGAAAVILVGASATASGGSTAGSFEAAAFTYVQVEAGQSLWQIAEAVAPGVDPRDVIYDIVQLNQLNSAEVQPGQQIAIPTRYTD